MQVKNSGAFKNDLIALKLNCFVFTIEENVQNCTGFIFCSFPVVIIISFKQDFTHIKLGTISHGLVWIYDTSDSLRNVFGTRQLPAYI